MCDWPHREHDLIFMEQVSSGAKLIRFDADVGRVEETKLLRGVDVRLAGEPLFPLLGGVILPLKMGTGDLMLLDFTTKTLARMGSNCKIFHGIHSSYYEPSDYNLIPIKCDYLILGKVTTKSNTYAPIISFHLFMSSDRKKRSEKTIPQVFPSHETWRNLPQDLKQEFCDIPAGTTADGKRENDEPRLPPLFEALRRMPPEQRQVLPGIQLCSGIHRLGSNPGCGICRNH